MELWQTPGVHGVLGVLGQVIRRYFHLCPGLLSLKRWQPAFSPLVRLAPGPTIPGVVSS
jgi:hypothetical protein